MRLPLELLAEVMSLLNASTLVELLLANRTCHDLGLPILLKDIRVKKNFVVSTAFGGPNGEQRRKCVKRMEMSAELEPGCLHEWTAFWPANLRTLCLELWNYKLLQAVLEANLPGLSRLEIRMVNRGLRDHWSPSLINDIVSMKLPETVKRVDVVDQYTGWALFDESLLLWTLSLWLDGKEVEVGIKTRIPMSTLLRKVHNLVPKLVEIETPDRDEILKLEGCRVGMKRT